MINFKCDCGRECKIEVTSGIGDLSEEQFFDLLDKWWMYKCMKEAGFSRKETDMIKKKQGAYARENNKYAKELKRMKYNKEQSELYEADKMEYEKFVKENDVVDVIGEEERAEKEAKLKEEKVKQKREERNKTLGGKILNFLDDVEKANTPEAKEKRKFAEDIEMRTGRVLTGEELDREWEMHKMYINYWKIQ